MDLERARRSARSRATRSWRGAPVEIADLAYDARAVTPGALFFCVPGRARRRPRLRRARRSSAARSALVVERPLASPCRSSSSPTPGAAMAPAADAFFGDPTRGARRRRRHRARTARRRPRSCSTRSSRRPAAGRGCSGRSRARVGDERRAAVRTTPGGDRPAADASARCSTPATGAARSRRPRTARSCSRLDGVRFAALVFTNLDARTTSTSTARWSATSRRSGGCSSQAVPPAAVNVGDEYGPAARRGAAAERSRSASPTTRSSGPERARRRSTCKLRGPFNVENALAARRAAPGCSASTTTRSRAGSSRVRGRPGPLRGRSTKASRSRCRRLLAHARRARERPRDGARARARPRDLRLRLRRRPRPRQAAGDGPDRRASSPTSRSSPPTTRAARIRSAIIDESLAGAAGELEVEPDRRAAIARALEHAQPGDVVVIAGKGHEQGQEFARPHLPFDDREVAREVLRALGAAA